MSHANKRMIVLKKIEIHKDILRGWQWKHNELTNDQSNFFEQHERVSALCMLTY